MKINALLPAAIAFAILDWIGSGADILGLLKEMYKESTMRLSLDTHR
jgi:hypothetical protein